MGEITTLREAKAFFNDEYVKGLDFEDFQLLKEQGGGKIPDAWHRTFETWPEGEEFALDLPSHVRATLAKQRVERGAGALDAYNEVSWRDMLREKKRIFDIGSPTNCVLGVRFGDYGVGREQLFEHAGVDEDTSGVLAVQHGFEADGLVHYHDLQRAWCDLLGIDINMTVYFDRG